MAHCDETNGGDMAEERWIPHEDMHPAMNIYGRKWRTADGSMSGVWDPMMPIPRKAYAKGIEWGARAEIGEPVEIVAPRMTIWGKVRAIVGLDTTS